MRNLKVIMADKGISITRLSEELEVSRNTLTGYYYEKNKNISIEYMNRIADYFDVSLDELFGRIPYTTD